MITSKQIFYRRKVLRNMYIFLDLSNCVLFVSKNMFSAVEKMEKFMFQMQLTVLIIKFSTKLEKRNAKFFAIFIFKGPHSDIR